jgi:hypothetical protein
MSLDGSYDMVLLPLVARQQQRRSPACPAAANSTTSSPRDGRAASGFVPPPSSPQEEETGQPWPGKRRHLVGCQRVDDAGTPAGDMSGVVLAPETTTSVVSPQRANPKRTDDASTLAKDLLGVSLVPEITVQFVPDATSSPSIDQEVPSVFHPVPFRFSFDPPSDPASVSAFVKAYPNLSGYHMWSSWDRLMAVSTYVDLGGRDEGNHLGMPEDDDPPGPASRVDILRELAVVPVPAGGQDTQLEQIREMQAKLDEEAGQLVQLRQNIEQEWAGRALAGEERHQARDVQRRIVDDARARLPPASSGVGQNLAAAAILL